jgi:hypothetical protein
MSYVLNMVIVLTFVVMCDRCRLIYLKFISVEVMKRHESISGIIIKILLLLAAEKSKRNFLYRFDVQSCLLGCTHL